MVWGKFAQEIGLIAGIEAIKIVRKKLRIPDPDKSSRIICGDIDRSEASTGHQSCGAALVQRPVSITNLGTEQFVLERVGKLFIESELKL